MSPDAQTEKISNRHRAAGFWQRRLLIPLLNQLKQGATPEKLAESVSWGVILGVFPILGTTTTLCGIAGITLRLNHIAIQTVNWLVYPLQLALIIPFLKLGNLLFLHEPMTLSLADITQRFADNFWAAAGSLGGLALRGMAAWLLVALPALLMVRRFALPFIRRLAATQNPVEGVAI